MKKNLFGYIGLIIVVLGSFILGQYMSCSAKQLTPLDRCLQSGKGNSWFGEDAIKDSVFVDKCQRFHREQLVDKYLYKIIRDENGDIKEFVQVKDKNESVFTKSEILLYIESGNFQRK